MNTVLSKQAIFFIVLIFACNAFGQTTTINICPPPNNQPCGAIYVPLASVANGTNVCADAVGEPPNAAQCTPIGPINTVWFKAIVPASGSLSVRTHPLTLLNTMIQAFTIPNCANAATNYTSLGCNDSGPTCFFDTKGFHDFSELQFISLTPGDTIYIAVDGAGAQTGTFEITFKDGSAAKYPPVYQQDCESPQLICNTTEIIVPDPGFRNTGNVCDLVASDDCWNAGIGERNSAWYQFTVDPSISGGTAQISFDILSDPATDIDFKIWNISGLSDACDRIRAMTLHSISCNFHQQDDSTGLRPIADSLLTAYSHTIYFSGAPQTFMMLLNDYNSNGNAGFKINWGTTPITGPSSAIWTGNTDSLFSTNTNWGNCSSGPSCSTDAFIYNSSNGRQPIITAGVKSVRSIVINNGATLTLLAGATLQVCGDFTNNGTLVCNPGSTIKFIGGANQTINGSLTGTNSFASLIIAKGGGDAMLQTNIDVTENFTTSTATSIFNINAKYMKVGGHFTNNSGNTTFTGILFSTVEFYKSSNQNFTNTTGSLKLHKVVMNKTAGNVYLVGPSSIMNIDSTLNLIKGRINTRSNSLLEVNVKNFQPSILIGYSANSYIDGALRRKISNGPFAVTGIWDFPVGDTLPTGGFELASINFNVSSTIPDLRASFTGWLAGTPPNKGPAASECNIATYAVLPIFNNGYWTITKSSSDISGNYNMELRNTGQTNNTGLGWTITTADLLSDPNNLASWFLQGTCDVSSTFANTKRNNINPIPSASTTFNNYYATAQTGTPLPIELLYFSAEPENSDVKCMWETASETNNEYFEVERSFDGIFFEALGKVNGFGLGISTESREYTFLDNDVCEGIRYYRLKQVDFDGQFSYSGIVAVNCGGDKERFNIYPNPAKSSIVCSFYENHEGFVKFQWLDLPGRITREEIHPVKKGLNTIETDVSDLAMGIYYFLIKETGNYPDDNTRQIKFLKN